MKQTAFRAGGLGASPKNLFDCGCPKDIDSWEDIGLDCQATWDMIGSGLTKGVFQLEKSLGRKWAKRIKPRSIEELSDIISLIRPGCLDAPFREDEKTGKMLSITETYARVKEGKLQAEYIHPSLEPILKSTFGTPVYQEQLMEICKEYAGWSLQEADDMRKAVGKKLKDKMAQLKDKFIDGAVKKGSDKATADTIFSWIEKFSDYGFNKSHGIGYATIGYRTAYAKVHYPLEFFKNMLAYSDSKMDEFDEIKELVNEAKLFNIKVLPPSVARGNSEFFFTEDGHLAFGLSHIKNVGESALSGLKEMASIKTEEELLNRIFTDLSIKSNVFEALVKSGALDYITKSRIRLLARYKFLRELTDREVEFLVNGKFLGKEIQQWIELLELNNIPKKGRIEKIKESLAAIRNELSGDNFKMKLAYEKYHLGMAISGSEVDIYHNEKVDTTCINFLNLPSNSRVAVGVIIEDVRELKDKNGNMMAFLKVSDNTYMLDGVVVFSSAYTKCGWIIEPGRAVLIKGRKKDVSLLVDSIDHL